MKVSTDILLNEISDDLNQFMKQGNLSSFTRKIDPNLNIDNIIKLLRIHFVLTTSRDNNKVGVIDFVKRLPQRLRRIKTTVKKETEAFEGEVKGKINWKDTIELRYNQNPENKALFVCDKKEKNYDISENLVLKRLLQIIYDIIYNDLNVAFENKYRWLKGWLSERDLKNVLSQIFLRNIYLKRIDLAETVVTDRMINKATKSRSALYRDAASLLTRYNKLMAYELDPSEAKELLNNTFIEPDKAETLFELYWVIKIINEFEDPRFQLIEPGSNVVAKWRVDNQKYMIYHDSVGTFEFLEKADEISHVLTEKDNYFGRELKVLKKIEHLTGIKTDSLWGGRPDIVLEKYDEHDNLVSIFIGEVKYTQERGYAIQGLKELLEYMALIKDNGMYVEKYKDLFEKPGILKGGLFIDFIDDDDKLNISDEEVVQIIMFGDKTNILQNFIKKWDTSS